jgi:Fe2+ transport system protein B
LLAGCCWCVSPPLWNTQNREEMKGRTWAQHSKKKKRQHDKRLFHNPRRSRHRPWRTLLHFFFFVFFFIVIFAVYVCCCQLHKSWSSNVLSKSSSPYFHVLSSSQSGSIIGETTWKVVVSFSLFWIYLFFIFFFFSFGKFLRQLSERIRILQHQSQL